MNFMILTFIMYCHEVMMTKVSPYATIKEMSINEQYLKWNHKCYINTSRKELFYHCDQLIHLHLKISLECLFVYVTCAKNSKEEELSNITSNIMKFSTSPTSFLNIEGCPSNYIGYYLSQDHIEIERVTITCKNYKDSLTVSLPLTKLSKLKWLEINCPWMKLPKAMFYGKMTNLQVLYISRTKIEKLDDGVFAELSNLERLSLKRNRIKTLKRSDFEGLISLSTLHIVESHLNTIDSDIFQTVPKVTDLTIEGWNVSRLPNSFQMLNLRRLFISRTSVINIDAEECKNFENFTSLIITGNEKLSIDPECFSYIKDIKEFKILGNRKSGFPKKNLTWINLTVFHVSDMIWENCKEGEIISGEYMHTVIMRNISMHILNHYFLSNIFSASTSTKFILDLSENNLQSLPIIPENFYIQNVTLSNNQLHFIPDSVFSGSWELNLNGNLLQESLFQESLSSEYLRVLNLGSNCFKSIPFLKMPNLTHLNLANNAIEIIDLKKLAYCETLTKLILSKNRIISLAYDSNETVVLNIQELQLSSNLFMAIPNLKLPYLEHLNLSDNYIDFLDFRVLRECKILKKLSLSQNLINGFFLSQTGHSAELILFSSYTEHPYVSKILSNLSLTGNNLNILDMSWVCSMRKLQNLFLRECNISIIIPYELCIFESELRILELSHNHIHSHSWKTGYDPLRKTLGRNSPFSWLINLEELYLAHNEIEHIPMDMRNLIPKLKILDLRYNKIKYLLHHDLLYTSSHLRPDHTVIPYDRGYYLTVDLRHNSIREVELPRHMLINNLTHKCDQHRYSHATLLLDNNPINCGCEIIPLMEVIEGDLILASELWREDKKDWVLQAKLEPGNLACGYPQSVKGKKIMKPETWMHHLLPTIGFCYAMGSLGEEN